MSTISEKNIMLEHWNQESDDLDQKLKIFNGNYLNNDGIKEKVRIVLCKFEENGEPKIFLRLEALEL